jgi:hypothetical protein
MKLTRKLFYNKRNGQASLTLPSKQLKKIQQCMNSDKPIKKLSFEILTKKEINNLKNGNYK